MIKKGGMLPVTSNKFWTEPKVEFWTLTLRSKGRKATALYLSLAGVNYFCLFLLSKVQYYRH